VVVGGWFLTVRPRLPERRHFESLFRFGRYSWLGALRERAWVWLDTLVLGLFVSAEHVGVYELGWRLSAAFFLVSSALSSTLFANVDRLLREQGSDAVSRTVEESLVYTGVVAIPGLVGALVVAEPLLATFGPAYAEGGLVLVVLILARLAHSYEVVFAKVINALDRPDLTFRADVTFVALNIVGNVVAIAAFGWVGAAVASAVSMGVRTVLSYSYLRSLVVLSVPVREVALEALAAVLMGATLLSLVHGDTLGGLELAVTIAGGGVLYAGLLLAFVGRIRTQVRSAVATFV
jgi:O-antigen/teichoic acid export membrane protein